MSTEQTNSNQSSNQNANQNQPNASQSNQQGQGANKSTETKEPRTDKMGSGEQESINKIGNTQGAAQNALGAEKKDQGYDKSRLNKETPTASGSNQPQDSTKPTSGSQENKPQSGTQGSDAQDKSAGQSGNQR